MTFAIPDEPLLDRFASRTALFIALEYFVRHGGRYRRAGAMMNDSPTRNATYLTDRPEYRGREATFWTPCIHRFLRDHAPVLPVTHCIPDHKATGPWLRARFAEPSIDFCDAELLDPEPRGTDVLTSIAKRFARENLTRDLHHESPERDLAGIRTDLFAIGSGSALFIENKPYYGSKFDGNQIAVGDYCELVQRLTEKHGIPAQYLVICSCSWRGFREMLKIQRRLGSRFGILLLEDIFRGMGEVGYVYEEISNWGNYTSKAADFRP